MHQLYKEIHKSCLAASIYILTVTITGMCSYEEDYCWPGTCQDQLAKNCDCAQGFVVSRSDSHAKCQRTYIFVVSISWYSFKTVFTMSPINRGIHLCHKDVDCRRLCKSLTVISTEIALLHQK